MASCYHRSSLLLRGQPGVSECRKSSLLDWLLLWPTRVVALRCACSWVTNSCPGCYCFLGLMGLTLTRFPGIVPAFLCASFLSLQVLACHCAIIQSFYGLGSHGPNPDRKKLAFSLFIWNQEVENFGHLFSAFHWAGTELKLSCFQKGLPTWNDLQDSTVGLRRLIRTWMDPKFPCFDHYHWLSHPLFRILLVRGYKTLYEAEVSKVLWEYFSKYSTKYHCVKDISLGLCPKSLWIPK